MTMRTFILGFCALQFLTSPLAAQAQSSDFDRTFARQGAEARLSFTVPLGNSAQKSKIAPRLNLGVRNYAQPSTASADWMRADRQDYRDVSLGFTLETTPKLMMNEQVLVLLKTDQANIGTAGEIGLRLVVAAALTAAVLAVIIVLCDDCPDSE